MTAVAVKGSSGFPGQLFKQSAAAGAKTTYLFHLAKSADGTDDTGVMPVVTISKAGGAFAGAAGVVSEISAGWYKCVFTNVDLSTLGALAINVAVATADTINEVVQVVAQDPYLVIAEAISSGTAQAGAAGTITLAAGESATDHLLEGALVRITGGTGSGQTRLITGYVGSTKVASVDRNWTTNPDSTSTYELIPTNPVIVDQVTLADSSLTAAKASGDFLAAVSAQLVTSPTVDLGDLTSTVTTISRSMKGAYDATVVIAGTFGGATVQIQTTEDENADSPVWTDRSSGGYTSAHVLAVAGPHSAWRATVTGGTATAIDVKVYDRYYNTPGL